MKHNTCRRGHPRTPENIYEYPRKDGSIRTMCRICNDIKNKQVSPKSNYSANFTKNTFRVDGDKCYIRLANNTEAIIDTSMIDAVIEKGRWCASSGYVVCATGRLKLHRFIMSAPASMYVDHISRNPLDCRRQNLRIVTPEENSQNTSIIGRKNGSGYKNVRWVKQYQRWRVEIKYRGKVYYGGHFTGIEQAIEAAGSLRRQMHSHCPENSLPAYG